MTRFAAVLLGIALLPAVTFGQPPWSHSTATLAHPRSGLAAVTVGTKALFVGGGADSAGKSVADVFDAATGEWSVSTLSKWAPGGCVGATVGSKAFIADSAGVVHVYDEPTGAWTTMDLPKRRYWMAAASAGGKVFFAGGNYDGLDFDRVDVYDTATSSWSLEYLSVGRWGLAGTGVGTQVLFAGGDEWFGPWQDAVDIYDTQTQLWTTTALSGRASGPAAVSVAGKALIAGGYGDGGFRTHVDIYDPATGGWSAGQLSQGRDAIAAGASQRFALFGGGWRRIAPDEYEASDVVDIYDSVSGEWFTDTLSVGRYNGAATGIGNVVLIAGGSDVTRTSLDTVDIFVMPDVADVVPPEVESHADPATLWPANHKMREVDVCIVASDDLSDPEDLSLVGAFASSSEPDGGKGYGHDEGDVNGEDGYTAPVDVTDAFVDQLVAGGCKLFKGTIVLRAERLPSGAGRAYTIEALVEDAAGNVASCTCEVTVPRRKPK